MNKPIRTVSGCRVGWEFYATQEEADQRVADAEALAAAKAAEGHDFGYCLPGEVTPMGDGTWRVTVP